MTPNDFDQHDPDQDDPDQHVAGEGLESASVLKMPRHLLYGRVAAEFAEIAKQQRERIGLTVEALSRASGVSIQRINIFERGKAAPYWQEAIALAMVYGVRMSVIAERLRRAEGDAADWCEHNHGRNTALSKRHCREQAMAYVRDTTDGDTDVLVEKLSEMSDDIVDITIADWPAILPPSFGEAISAELHALMPNMKIVTTVAAHHGAPVPYGISDPNAARKVSGEFGKIFVGAGPLLDRVHFHVEGVRSRLEWLVTRHLKTPSGLLQSADRRSMTPKARRFASEPLDQRLTLQCSRLTLVMTLLDVVRPGGERDGPAILEALKFMTTDDVAKFDHGQIPPNFEATLTDANKLMLDTALALREIAEGHL
jgi:transcriptional regulator with XRE-family HTH domain